MEKEVIYYINDYCPVPVLQLKYEFEKLLNIYIKKSPKNILEIGSLYGGTLWHWIAYGNKNNNFTVIDKYSTDDRNSDVKQKQEQCYTWLWKQWASVTNSSIDIHIGDSKDNEIYNKVKQKAPFDFIFIDGDHSYNGVKSDYLKYKELIQEGGIIAFHDILKPLYDNNEIEVYKLWEEIKEEGNITQELYSSKKQSLDGSTYGIGLVYF